MFSLCINFYGSELWDLGNPNVQDFCIAWRKGLRRVWGLPYTTPVLTNTIPIIDELHRRTAIFINNCLSSNCRVVQAVARHGVYFGLLKTPIGRNVFQCYSLYGVRSSKRPRVVWLAGRHQEPASHVAESRPLASFV